MKANEYSPKPRTTEEQDLAPRTEIIQQSFNQSPGSLVSTNSDEDDVNKLSSPVNLELQSLRKPSAHSTEENENQFDEEESFNPRGRKPYQQIGGDQDVRVYELRKEIRKSVRYLIVHYLSPAVTASVWTVLIVLAQMLWSYSDNTCSDDIVICLYKYNTKYLNAVFSIAAWSAIHCYIPLQCLITKKQKLRFYGLALVFLSASVRWVQSPGYYGKEYGAASNTLAYLFCLAFGLIFAFYYLSFLLHLKLKGENRRWFYLYVSFSVTVGLLWWLGRFSYTCKNLQKSLDPEITYEPSDTICNWKQPTSCPQYTYDGIFTPLYWGRKSCKAYETDLNQERML